MINTSTAIPSSLRAPRLHPLLETFLHPNARLEVCHLRVDYAYRLFFLSLHLELALRSVAEVVQARASRTGAEGSDGDTFFQGDDASARRNRAC